MASGKRKLLNDTQNVQNSIMLVLKLTVAIRVEMDKELITHTMRLLNGMQEPVKMILLSKWPQKIDHKEKKLL